MKQTAKELSSEWVTNWIVVGEHARLWHRFKTWTFQVLRFNISNRETLLFALLSKLKILSFYSFFLLRDFLVSDNSLHIYGALNFLYLIFISFVLIKWKIWCSKTAICSVFHILESYFLVVNVQSFTTYKSWCFHNTKHLTEYHLSFTI